MKVKWYLLILANVLSLITISVKDYEVRTSTIWYDMSVTLIGLELFALIFLILFVGLGKLIYDGYFKRIYDWVSDVLNYKIP